MAKKLTAVQKRRGEKAMVNRIKAGKARAEVERISSLRRLAFELCDDAGATIKRSEVVLLNGEDDPAVVLFQGDAFVRSPLVRAPADPVTYRQAKAVRLA